MCILKMICDNGDNILFIGKKQKWNFFLWLFIKIFNAETKKMGKKMFEIFHLLLN